MSEFIEDIVNIGKSKTPLCTDDLVKFTSKHGIGVFQGESALRSRTFPWEIRCFSDSSRQCLAERFKSFPYETVAIKHPQKAGDIYNVEILEKQNGLSVNLLDDSPNSQIWLSAAKEFLMEIANGFLDASQNNANLLFFLNKISKNIQNLSWWIRFEGTPEKPQINMTYPKYVIIGDYPPYWEDELLIQAFLSPYMNGKAENWMRIKKCKMCGKYFFYKLKRATFCSANCRVRFANLQKEEFNMKKPDTS